MMGRRWLAHIAGLAMCFAALCYGYSLLSGALPFDQALVEATVVPLWGMARAGPLTILVCCMWVLLVGGVLEFKRWPWILGAYALPAGYWCFLAQALSDLDL